MTVRVLIAAVAALALSCAHSGPLTLPIDSADASILVADAFEFLWGELPPATSVLVFPQDADWEPLNGGLRQTCRVNGYAMGVAYGFNAARRVWASFRRAGEDYLLEVDLSGVAMTRWYTRMPGGKLLPAGPRVVRRTS